MLEKMKSNALTNAGNRVTPIIASGRNKRYTKDSVL